MDSQQLKAVVLFSMGLMLVGAYLILSWVFPTAEAERRVRSDYENALANYTCIPKGEGCVVGSMYYSPCIYEELGRLNFSANAV